MVGEGASVRYSVLGPLAVVGPDGGALPLRSAARRRLLALLLTRPGEVVLADRLIDQVWYEDPPLGRGAFHVQVSRLRKELSEEGGLSPIVTEPGGYRFQAASDEIDWLRFVRLVDLARSAADPADAATRYGEALALWRGEALEDVLGPPAIDEHARHLDHLRRTATLEHAAVLADLGRHDQVVGLLDPLHRQAPFDEAIGCALARSAAGAGRRDRAIAVVEAVARAYRDELGLDPPAAVDDLHRQLLEPGPLEPPTSVPRSDEVERPTAIGPALPPIVLEQRFVGRSAELDALVDAVRGADGPDSIAVVGPSGIGKTTLVVHGAARLRAEGHHVRFASCAASPALVGNGLRSLFADLLGATPPTRGRRGDRVTSAEVADVLVTSIAERLDRDGVEGAVVLVVDDLHLADEVDARAIRGLLDLEDHRWFATIVATARTADALGDRVGRAMVLGALAVDEIGASLEDPSLAAPIAELTAGVPSAVAKVLGMLDRTDPGEHAEAIRSLREGGVADLDLGPSPRRSSPLALELLQLLSVADGPLDAVTLAAASSSRARGGEDAVAAALVELIDEGEAIERSDGSIVVSHELLAGAVRRRLDADAIRQLERRLMAATSAHDPWVPTNAHLLAAADERRSQLLDAARSAAQLGAFGEAERIAAIVLETSASTADRLGSLLVIGECRTGLGDDDGARSAFEDAFDLAEGAGAEPALAAALTGLLGGWFAGVGPSDDQVARIDRALRAIHEPAPRAIALARAVGAHLGGDPRCRSWADEAVDLAAASDDPMAVAAAAFAHSLANLGWPGARDRFDRTGHAARTASVDIGYDRYAALLGHHLVAAIEVGDLDAAGWCVERQGWIAEVTRRPLHVWRSQVMAATNAMASADLDRAERSVDAAAATAQAHRLADGRMTERLQRAALRCWGSEVDPLDRGYRPLARAVPHPLSHALDAVVLVDADAEAARSSLDAALAGCADLPHDYLRWATVAATRIAAGRLGDDSARSVLDALAADADVRCAVLAVGTAALPMP